MKLNRATILYAMYIANLHKKGIPTGFLSKQSILFLEALYAYIVKIKSKD